MTINLRTSLSLLASIFLLSPVAVCHLSSPQRSPFNQNYDYVIIVDPTNETAVDGEDCRPPQGGGNSSVPCRTFHYALQQLDGDTFLSGSIKFYLASPDSTYELHYSQNLSNRCNVGIHGNDSRYPLVPEVNCAGYSGLSFVDACNIELRTVQFKGCGAPHISTSKDYSKNDVMSFLTIRVCLYFYNCTNVEMYDVRVIDSPQAIGVVMYDTNGVVDVMNCIFSNNAVSSNGSHAGGGGYTVEFTYCKPGDMTCTQNQTEYNSDYKRNKNSNYTFNNCTFEDNIANKPQLLSEGSHIIIPSKSNHDATGKGGGLSMFFKGDAMNNSINIVDSRFRRNYAVWGGGLYIQMSDTTVSNAVFLSNCDFSENHAVFTEKGKYTAGGGLNIVINTQAWDKNTRSKIHVSDCSFLGNQALEGGGMSCTISRQNVLNVDQILEMLVSNSTFESNQARLGSAVLLVRLPIFNSGFSPEVEFHDCQFSGNKLIPINYPIHAAGMAAVYVSKIPTSFRNSAVFINNTGSALVVSGCRVNFTGTNATFDSNDGADGGAIALLGVSSILVGPNTNMTFVNNTAKRYGGAIYNCYIGNEDLESTPDCFVRYSEPFVPPDQWKLWFNFSGNTAHQDGCSIVSSSLYPCSWGESYFDNISSVFRWNERWHYSKNRNCEKPEITTRAKDFTLRNQSFSESPSVSFFPGRPFNIPLEAWDEFGNDVTDDTVYSVSILNGDSIAEVDPGYTYVASNYISISGKPGNNITLLMETAGSRTIHVEVDMVILDCPPGFIPPSSEDKHTSESSMTRCKCPDDDHKYRDLLKCYYTDFVAKIDITYWYGPVNTTLPGSQKVATLYLMGSAPIPYRFVSKRYNTSIRLPRSMDEVEEKFCGSAHRRGVLCGKCHEGYAVAVNSPTYECVRCNYTTEELVKNLFVYVVLTYVPIIIVFIVIIAFKVKLASSAAAGFLVYAQIISSGCFDVTSYSWLHVGSSSNATVLVQNVYMFFYSIFNLASYSNYLNPFCLNENFTTLHVLCLDYAIAIFPLVVIVVIYLGYKCKSIKCNCLMITKAWQTTGDSSSVRSLQAVSSTDRPHRKNRPNNSLIHALMAFMLLSYTKFSIASMRTVILDELFDSAGDLVTHRIYLAGHLSFSDPLYLLPFGIPAILVLVFIVFLPPLLLLGPLQFMDWLIDKPKLNWLRRYWPSIKIHTFLDTFQGYNPNRRFFVGLYLLFRLFMFLTHSFSADLLTQYIIQQVIIIVLAVLVPLLRPYERPFFNYLDTMLFLNLGILNAIAIYSTGHSYSAVIYSFACVLVFLPLVYITFYIIWNKCHKRKLYKRIKRNITIHLINPVRASYMGTMEERQLLLYAESVNNSGEDPDIQIFRRAEKGNRFRGANISTISQRRTDEVPETVINIQAPQLPRIEEEEEVEKKESENSKRTSGDSGIGKQTDSGGLDTKQEEFEY